MDEYLGHQDFQYSQKGVKWEDAFGAGPEELPMSQDGGSSLDASCPHRGWAGKGSKRDADGNVRKLHSQLLGSI